MANVLGTLFGDIAEAIRGKTGSTDKMAPADFPAQIASITTGGGSGGGSSGGGNGTSWEVFEHYIPVTMSTYPYGAFVFQDKLHVVFKNSTTSKEEIWRCDEDGWVYFSNYPTSVTDAFAEANGELHCVQSYLGKHYKFNFDTNTWVQLSEIPDNSTNYSNKLFAVKNELYVISGSKGKTLLKWDGSAWNTIATLADSPDAGFCVDGDTLYHMSTTKNLYKYDFVTGEETLIHTHGSNDSWAAYPFVIGGEVYHGHKDAGRVVRKYVDGYPVDLPVRTIFYNSYGAHVVWNNRLYCFGTYGSTGYSLVASWAPASE